MESPDGCQRQALQLLEEWWTSTDDDEFLPVIKAALFGYAFSKDRYSIYTRDLRYLTPDEDLWLFDAAETSLLTLEGMVFGLVLGEAVDDVHLFGDPDLTNAGSRQKGATYHRGIFNIFLYELCPGGEADARLQNLRGASLFAASLRLGRSWYEYSQDSIAIGASSPPNTAGRMKMPTLQDFSCNIPITVNPCPWLATETGSAANSGDDLPYYLWDILAAQIVPVATITRSEASYGIVSHTWGRWRLEGEGVRVPGVPWLVPRIGTFDVRRQPGMLAAAGFPERYVWVDLLCIPQEEDVGWQARICRAELPRRAAIFGNAGTAVAWLNDAPGWRGAEAAIAWLALRPLQLHMRQSREWRTFTEQKTGAPLPVPPPPPQRQQQSPAADKRLEHILELARSLASQPNGFELPVAAAGLEEEGEETETETEPLRWLSSLWTLQESIMRPDMLLLNQDWEPLVVGGEMEMALEWICALLVTTGIDTGDSLREYPASPFQVATCMLASGMLHVVNPNRLVPLMLGRDQSCTHSRAAAIMSITGGGGLVPGAHAREVPRRRGERRPGVRHVPSRLRRRGVREDGRGVLPVRAPGSHPLADPGRGGAGRGPEGGRDGAGREGQHAPLRPGEVLRGPERGAAGARRPPLGRGLDHPARRQRLAAGGEHRHVEHRHRRATARHPAVHRV